MIGAEKPVHYNRVFTITSSTINGIDCIQKWLYYQIFVEPFLSDRYVNDFQYK
jgi:hypothetical protein